MSAPVRVRYAPSPTGYLHVGGARTALFNYLFAQKMGGTFILRIEDTDRTRYVPEALDEIFASMKWLGLNWTEGPGVGGNYGPYVQSERLDLYKKYALELLDKKCAYRCFCTSERLDASRKAQEAAKAAPGYDRHCRDLPNAEVQKLLAANTPHVIRFRIPFDRTVVFNDLIRGKIEYASNVLDDLVLLKTDGFPTYHLANVVDDHSMEISHVLRGDEWIASTPRHVLMYEAFGWTPPIFAHLPIILDPKGGKLSKRKGAASVMDFKKNGFLPDALFNFLAFLGWSLGDGDNREKLTREELIAAYDLNRVSAKSAVFDETKLEWLNGLYMTELSVAACIPEILALWQEMGVVDNSASVNDPHIVTAVTLLKDRSKRLTDLAQNGVYFFKDPTVYEDKAAKKYFKPEAAELLGGLRDALSASDFSAAALEETFRQRTEATGLSGGAFIHPTRLAVSGVSFGPGLFELLEALCKETVLRRVDAAMVWIKKNSAAVA